MRKMNNYKDVYPQNESDQIAPKLDRSHSPYKVLAHRDLLESYLSGNAINPIHVRMGLTCRCNCHCHFCNFHDENEREFYNLFDFKDELNTSGVMRFMKEFSENGGKAITFCGSGECTIHSGYKDICYYARDLGLKIGLITNGIKLIETDMFECVKKTHTWVRIGLNAGSGQTYRSVTGCNTQTFEDILDVAHRLKYEGEDKEFKVGLNYVITLRNYFDIENAAHIARNAGVDYIRYEPEFYSETAHQTIYSMYDTINDLLEKAKEYTTDNFEVSIPKLNRGAMTGTDKVEGDFSVCRYCNFVTAVGADGMIYPCPQVHLNETYMMGNVIEEGYANWIKNGGKEKWLKEHPFRTDICKTCFYRPQNELLEWLYRGSLDLETAVKDYKEDSPITIHKEFV